ncbi:MAG: SDR family NAD(P)-dependent oxidoreductase [Anaerostipes sp.]|nr:SDR family NAD(P)-dependent oxidoreductase [Anaerostipes sp.]
MRKKIAIVTGASSGMGREFIKQITMRYSFLDEVWVIARRMDRLEQLESKSSKIKIVPMAMDLNDISQFTELEDKLKEENPKVFFLVNSAGFGSVGLFEDLDEKDVGGMIDINCRALTMMTYKVLPFMSKGAYIYQFASSAAFVPQPKFGIYAATKSFVLSFSKSLNVELKDRHIKVVAICPGPVKTEFFDLAYEKTNIKMYKLLVMAKPEKVVEKVLKDGANGKSVSVYGLPMKMVQILCKLFPWDFAMKFIR